MGKKQKLVAGIDGGGTKTVGVIGDGDLNILARVEEGASAPRNVGINEAVRVLDRVIKELFKKGDPSFIFIALAGIQEQPHYREKIRKELLKKHPEVGIEVGSDQIVAFRSGTDERDGLLLIAGTGSVAHGWKGKKEAKASGWGYLEDKGSAFWAGRKSLQAIFESLDGRGEKTLIKDIAWQELGLRDEEDLLNRVYDDPLRMVPRFSVFCDKAAQKEDKIALSIMKEAGEELSLSVLTVARKLGFKEKFPLVLVGSMFKSPHLLETVKKEVRDSCPKVEFVRPEKEAVAGALKIALEKR